MKILLADAERLEKVLEIKKISRNGLSSLIDDKSGTKLYHISKGRNKFSKKLSAAITEVYPDINYKWLLTGEGNPVNEKMTQESSSKLSVEEINIISDAFLLNEEEVKNLPVVKKCIEAYKLEAKNELLIELQKIKNKG